MLEILSWRCISREVTKVLFFKGLDEIVYTLGLYLGVLDILNHYKIFSKLHLNRVYCSKTRPLQLKGQPLLRPPNDILS